MTEFVESFGDQLFRTRLMNHQFVQEQFPIKELHNTTHLSSCSKRTITFPIDDSISNQYTLLHFQSNIIYQITGEEYNFSLWKHSQLEDDFLLCICDEKEISSVTPFAQFKLPSAQESSTPPFSLYPSTNSSTSTLDVQIFFFPGPIILLFLPKIIHCITLQSLHSEYFNILSFPLFQDSNFFTCKLLGKPILSPQLLLRCYCNFQKQGIKQINFDLKHHSISHCDILKDLSTDKYIHLLPCENEEFLVTTTEKQLLKISAEHAIQITPLLYHCIQLDTMYHCNHNYILLQFANTKQLQILEYDSLQSVYLSEFSIRNVIKIEESLLVFTNEDAFEWILEMKKEKTKTMELSLINSVEEKVRKSQYWCNELEKEIKIRKQMEELCFNSTISNVLQHYSLKMNSHCIINSFAISTTNSQPNFQIFDSISQILVTQMEPLQLQIKTSSKDLWFIPVSISQPTRAICHKSKNKEVQVSTQSLFDTTLDEKESIGYYCCVNPSQFHFLGSIALESKQSLLSQTVKHYSNHISLFCPTYKANQLFLFLEQQQVTHQVIESQVIEHEFGQICYFSIEDGDLQMEWKWNHKKGFHLLQQFIKQKKNCILCLWNQSEIMNDLYSLILLLQKECQHALVQEKLNFTAFHTQLLQWQQKTDLQIVQWLQQLY